MLLHLSKLRVQQNYTEGVEFARSVEPFFENNPVFLMEFAAHHLHNGQRQQALELWGRASAVSNSLTLSFICFKNITKVLKFNPNLGRKWKEFPPSQPQVPKPNPKVVMTMTTCKRFDLFQRTIASFFTHADYHLIDELFIVDDNSSEQDRQAMREITQRLPIYTTIYFKTEEEKGHAQSMNIIRKYILDRPTLKYFVHIEDDFEFLFPFPLIKEAVGVLEDQSQYGQCLFNNGYKEELEEGLSPWGRRRSTAQGHLYYEHIFETGVNPCSYWSHFSLRPGVNRVDILHLGEFIENGASFEKDYAMRYIDKGWRTAYLPFVYSEHIGRKTKDRFQEQLQNAYSLNQTGQFNYLHCRSFLIHLPRRTDRLEGLALPDYPPITMFDAVDGQTLKPCAELNTLFGTNTYDMLPGVVGCALSHLKLWRNLVAEYKQCQYYLILEDDITFSPNFVEQVNALNHSLNQMFMPWDVVFLGYHPNKPIENVQGEGKMFQVKDFASALHISLGGTFAYFIKYNGAMKLLNYIQNKGMVNAIDIVMQRAVDDGLKVFYLLEPAVLVRPSASDIQPEYQKPFMNLHNASLGQSSWGQVWEYVDSFGAL